MVQSRALHFGLSRFSESDSADTGSDDLACLGISKGPLLGRSIPITHTELQTVLLPNLHQDPRYGIKLNPEFLWVLFVRFNCNI